LTIGQIAGLVVETILPAEKKAAAERRLKGNTKGGKAEVAGQLSPDFKPQPRAIELAVYKR
jgi:hypothetical protein